MKVAFLAKLGEFFRSNKDALVAGEISEEEIQQVIKQARASSGGKQKAENRMSMSEQFGKGGEWKLFMEQQFAEPPRTIQVLPKPGSYSHPAYGKFSMSPSDIQSFVDNHNSHVYQKQVPIDAEHESKLSGAVGYYGEMRVLDGGRGGAEADVEWTDRGKELIASDRFKYFSPEWFDVWTDPVGGKKIANVLVGGAIVTRPFFKDKVMRPLVASPDSYFQAGEWSEDTEGEQVVRTLTFREMQFAEFVPFKKKDEEDDDEEEAKKKKALDPGDVHVDGLVAGGKKKETKASGEPASTAGGKTMAENAVIDDATKAFVEEQVAEKTKSFNEVIESERGLRTAAETRLATLEQEAQTRRFSDVIMGRDGEGDGSPPMAGQHKTHQTMLSILAKEFTEDSDQFREYVSEQRAISKQMREAGLFKEAGVGSGPDQTGSTAARRFDDAVKAYITEHPDKRRDEATVAVSKESPKLYNEYIKEQNHKARTTDSTYGNEEGGE